MIGRGLIIRDGKLEPYLQDGSLGFSAENKIYATGIDNTGSLGSGVPAGTVIYTAGRNPPAGYFIADGAWCQKEDFVELFAALSADTDGVNVSGMYDEPVTQEEAEQGIFYYQRDEVLLVTAHIYNLNSGSGKLTAAETIKETNLFRLPDLRGVFLRGAGNNSVYDADGSATEEQLGKFTTDSIRAHTHVLSSYGGTITEKVGTGGTSYTRPNYITAWQTNSFGGSETAPKHVSLLPCIKY